MISYSKRLLDFAKIWEEAVKSLVYNLIAEDKAQKDWSASVSNNA